MLFLQLAAGGHLLLFVVRTPHSVFAPPYPSLPLFLAIVGTQIVAVLMCAYGVLVPQLPWLMIGVVWAYVLVWTLVARRGEADLLPRGRHARRCARPRSTPRSQCPDRDDRLTARPLAEAST